jgi:hypothetical protein
MEYIQKEKEECFSLYFLCVFAAAAAPNRRHYFVKVCSTTAAPVGDFVSAGFLHLIVTLLGVLVLPQPIL